MWRVIFRRDGNNPLTGSARYRVAACFEAHVCFDRVLRMGAKETGLLLSRPRRKGTIINPRKALGI